LTTSRKIRVPNLRIGALLAVFLPALLLAANQASATVWRAEVDPALLAAAGEPGPLEFIIVLRQQADLSPAVALDAKDAKGAFVYHSLTEVAAASQREYALKQLARQAKIDLILANQRQSRTLLRKQGKSAPSLENLHR